MTEVSASESTKGSARRLGVAVVGVGGAVATTMVAGLELLRRGLIDTTGLPLAGLERREPELAGRLELAGYEAIVIAGWDVKEADGMSSARAHGVLGPEQIEQGGQALAGLRPWPAVADERFSPAVKGSHFKRARGHRHAVELIREDLERFRREEGLDALVVLNLASTEVRPNGPGGCATPAELDRALDGDSPEIGPGILYALAAIEEGAGYINFTPSRAAEVPALRRLAQERGVPVCGQDGKTGQTLIKTVLAPALRDRNLRVEGWFSTNLLGNRDGLALSEAQSLASKVATKRDVLDVILGYRVENHQVHIHYYPPRGDAKEAWDSVDLVGFAGGAMQVKIDFQCRDSILAAPLAIDLARLIDLAARRGEGGVIEPLGVFFKAPMTHDGGPPDHDFFRQQEAFLRWLRG